MSNEQLREALRETLLFCETFSNRWDGETGAHPFDMVERARQALATTEPAVNQQLTTEPLDERAAFEKWAAPNRFDVGHKGEDGSYLGLATGIAWAAWQARAALQSSADVRDAERLDFIEKHARCDPKMDGQHVWWPTTFKHALKGPTLRDAIDAAIDAAMAKGVK